MTTPVHTSHSLMRRLTRVRTPGAAGRRRAGRLARLTGTVLAVAGVAAAAAPPEQPSATAAGSPPHEEVPARATFNPGPELQRAPGGSLIVNAFIMDGPVRVEIRDKASDALLVERESGSLFPFEVSHAELQVPPQQVQVRIFVRGELIHELILEEGEQE